MTLTTRWARAAAVAVLLTGGFAAGTVATHAQGGPRGGFGRGGHDFGLMREIGIGRLDLTDAQRQQVRTILQGQRDTQGQIRQRMRAAHKALNDAVSAPAFDEAAVRARSAELAAVQADAAVVRARIRSEVWAILTPEQQQKATELRAKMAERFQQRQQLRQQQRQQRQQPQQQQPPQL